MCKNTMVFIRVEVLSLIKTRKIEKDVLGNGSRSALSRMSLISEFYSACVGSRKDYIMV